ncbi:hypothetical protein IB691_07780 [Fangia hongkongensis]|nr:hypothetical protein [Fangia hongkongensis]
MSLNFDEDIIMSTPQHLFYYHHLGFSPVQFMAKCGSHYSIACLSISASSVHRQDAKDTVYNIEVENFHTYFIGRQGLWVHNECWLNNMDIDGLIADQNTIRFDKDHLYIHKKSGIDETMVVKKNSPDILTVYTRSSWIIPIKERSNMSVIHNHHEDHLRLHNDTFDQQHDHVHIKFDSPVTHQNIAEIQKLFIQNDAQIKRKDYDEASLWKEHQRERGNMIEESLSDFLDSDSDG